AISSLVSAARVVRRHRKQRVTSGCIAGAEMRGEGRAASRCDMSGFGSGRRLTGVVPGYPTAVHTSPPVEATMKRTAQVLGASALALAGCNARSSLQTDRRARQKGLTLASLSKAASAQTLNDLRRLTAPLHDVDAAE